MPYCEYHKANLPIPCVDIQVENGCHKTICLKCLSELMQRWNDVSSIPMVKYEKGKANRYDYKL